MAKLLVLPKINIHNANALSSPFTIGFPAMTAWLGATHALQRTLNQDGFTDFNVTGTGVISHRCDLQTHRGTGDYVHSIIGTGNPLDKDGSRSSFIEEPRCHLTVSLIIEFEGVDQDESESLLASVTHHLHQSMKIAGGDILSFGEIEAVNVGPGDRKQLDNCIRKVMPGYAIFERRELMLDAIETSNGDAMDALLDYVSVHQACEQDEEGNVHWHRQRKTSGWIVPIATGFQGISDLGDAKNQRDPSVPHRFAEAVVTLGEFKMPIHLNSIEQLLWRYQVEPSSNLYLCQQATSTR